MIRLRHKLLVHALRVFDPVVLCASLLAALSLVGAQGAWSRLSTVLVESFQVRDGLGAAVLVVGWIATFAVLVHYDPDRFMPLESELIEVTMATSASSFYLLVIGAVFSFGRISSEVVLFVWVSSTTVTIASRVATRLLLRAARRSGYNYRRLVIVGDGPRALDVAARIERLPELGYHIVGFVAADRHGQPAAGWPSNCKVLGRLDDVQHVLETASVDEIALCLPAADRLDHIFRILRLAQELGIVARLFPDDSTARALERLQVERFDGQSVVTFFRERLVLQLLVKRLLDISLSLTALVLLSPLLLAVAVAIRLTSAGPVLFVQRRVGMNKRVFRLYKFRSMYVDAERRRAEVAHLNEMDGPVFKIRDDPRVTPLGRLLRTSSIDELPQLWNVVRGQMSLVGPRPPLPAEVDQYEWLYRKRLSIKPGVTCLWQVSGRNRLSFSQWMDLDRRYVETWSLWLDLKILARTIPAVLSLKGAS